MVKIRVSKSLLKQLLKTFKKQETHNILDLFDILKENPKKGKIVGQVGDVLIKELKYDSFRFYFLVSGYKIKFLETDEIKDIVMKFIRMSKKNDQQEIINEIKELLKKIGFEKI